MYFFEMSMCMYMLYMLYIIAGISDIILGCTHVRGSGGNISSPGYPLPYTRPTYQMCWTIHAYPPYKYTTFHILDLDLEPSCSNVKIGSQMVTNSSQSAIVIRSSLVKVTYHQNCSSRAISKHIGFHVWWYLSINNEYVSRPKLKTEAVPTNNSIQVLTELSGVILSPGYPLSYPKNFRYNWTIIAKRSRTIDLKFLYFNITRGDTVKLYVGGLRQPLLKRTFYLTQLPFTYTTIYDVIYIVMTTREQQSPSIRRAFAIQWNATYYDIESQGSLGIDDAVVIGGCIGFVILLCVFCRRENLKKFFDKVTIFNRSVLRFIRSLNGTHASSSPTINATNATNATSPSVIDSSIQTNNATIVSATTSRHVIDNDLPPTYTDIITNERPTYDNHSITDETGDDLPTYEQTVNNTPRRYTVYAVSPRITSPSTIEENHGSRPEADNRVDNAGTATTSIDLDILNPTSRSRSQSLSADHSILMQSNADSLVSLSSVRAGMLNNSEDLSQHEDISQDLPPPPSYEDIISRGRGVHT